MYQAKEVNFWYIASVLIVPQQFLYIDGFVSVDFLEYEWSPALRTRTIILSVQSLLDTPNEKIFLNHNAAKLYKENKNKYNEVVKKYTSKYANYSILKREIEKFNIKDKISVFD